MTKYQTALVTGGAGFIGSHIVDGLIERGWKVHVIDNLSTGQKKNLNPKATFKKMSLLSPKFESYLRKLKPDVIFHLAAQINLRQSVIDPTEDARVNIMGTLKLAHAAGEIGVKKIIFSSTGGPMYPEDAKLPYAEHIPPAPISPYGISKRAGEMYLHFAHRVHGIAYVALRYANVYGPRQNPKGEAGVISIFAEKMLAGDVVGITGTGEQTRDFVFVGDVVEANMRAMESDAIGVFNIGTGKQTSIRTLFEEMKQLTGYTGSPKKLPAPPGEVMRSALSAARARKELGWKPTYTLKQGLKKTVSWFGEK